MKELKFETHVGSPLPLAGARGTEVSNYFHSARRAGSQAASCNGTGLLLSLTLPFFALAAFQNQSGVPKFIDITPTAGIEFRHFNGDANVKTTSSKQRAEYLHRTWGRKAA